MAHTKELTKEERFNAYMMYTKEQLAEMLVEYHRILLAFESHMDLSGLPEGILIPSDFTPDQNNEWKMPDAIEADIINDSCKHLLEKRLEFLHTLPKIKHPD